MPMKTGLKLLAPIGSDRADPERKLFCNVVHELDRTILVMFRKNHYISPKFPAGFTNEMTFFSRARDVPGRFLHCNITHMCSINTNANKQRNIAL